MSIRLELRGVEVSFGSVTALHPLTLTVEPGEFFCLLGPSGCGKSTTLGVIAGFLRASAGQVLLNGHDVTTVPPQGRRLGIVFQNYALFPHMTAAANIGYGLKLQGKPKAQIDGKVEELLALVHLEGKGARYPRQLSGGEQQRVAIARALAIEPRLLLLDEPLSNLDARLREEMGAELQRIQRQTGLTTIFVTHDQEEAFGVGDRVAVLNKGRIEQIGTPREIYGRPKSQFVASFIGRSNRLAIEQAIDGHFTINGHRFEASSTCDNATGSTFFLRPEELYLNAGEQHCNRLDGRITSSVYSGTLASYRISTAIGELEACELAPGRKPLAVGEEVSVSWDREAGCMLPDNLHE